MQTERLILDSLKAADAPFILELLNTPGWLKFIGDREVNSIEDARNYIRTILNKANVTYWVVKLVGSGKQTGVITFMKREELEFPDLGFAFLPESNGKGFAFEAASVVLNSLFDSGIHQKIGAITIDSNVTSIRLLQKLGMKETKKENRNGENLLHFELDSDTAEIRHLTGRFYSLFTNKNKEAATFPELEELCIREALIIKKTAGTEEIHTLKTFFEPRKKMLSDGSLTDFEELEIEGETRIHSLIAQRFSRLHKSGKSGGAVFESGGTKLFQFLKSGGVWKISAVIWEDH